MTEGMEIAALRQADQLLQALPDLDRGAILRGEDIGPAYMRDAEAAEGARPALVLRPATTSQVSAILLAATALRQPIVVQGGRTGLAGGARPRAGEVALSLERMTTVEPYDAVTDSITVGAGAPLEAVQRAAAAAGRYFGVDIGARGTATIGGNIATNAGGIRVLRYGMFRQQVAGLEAVLPDGTIIDALNRPPKDNAGYDLRTLMIGSEGTLGVVTRARLHLHPLPSVEIAAFVALPSLAAALEVLAALRQRIGDLLSAFEVIDPSLYAETLAHAKMAAPLPTGAGFYALIEIHSNDRDRAEERFQEALATVIESGLATDAVLSASGREFAALWAIRDGINDYLFAQPDMSGHDIGLPLGRMSASLPRIAAALREADPAARPLIFGHLGDGNLHYMVETRQPELTTRAVLTAVAAEGGTITAEHGIGRDKAKWLHLVRSHGEIAAMRRLKAAFDPHDILNPGRVLRDGE